LNLNFVHNENPKAIILAELNPLQGFILMEKKKKKLQLSKREKKATQHADYHE